MIRDFLLYSSGLTAILAGTQPTLAQIAPLSEQQFSQSAPSSAEAVETNEVQITDVQVRSTSDGLQIRLQSLQSATLQPTQTQTEQQIIVEIPNARLQVENWRQENPAPEIAVIEVTQVDDTVRVTVTGTTSAPLVDINTDSQGIVLILTSVSETAETLEPPVAQTPDVPAPLPNAIRIIVTGEPETYRVSESSVGTRTDTDIRDVPQSIQVIPEQVIEDQGVRTVGESVQNTAGISTGRVSSDSLATQLVIRGFPTDNILRNGLRDSTQRFTTGITNVERIEVLRGPASVLYGLGDLGGTVNIVTKQPLDQFFAELEYEIGQFDSHRPVLDLSIPFGEDDEYGFRVNAAYDSSGSFRDFEQSEFWFVSPSLSLIDTETTTLTADLEYLKFSSNGGAPELPAVGTVVENPSGDVDRSANLGEPNLAESEIYARRVGYLFEHRFNPDWRIRNEFLAAFVDFDANRFALPIFRPELEDFLSLRIIAENPSEQENYTLNTNILGEFETGDFSHQLLVGVELFRDRLADQITYRNVDNINIFDPVYRPESLGQFEIPQTDTETETDSIGLYAQHQISLLDRLILVLGGRFDVVDQNYEDILNPEQGFDRRDQAFSPRVGLVYKPAEEVSVYASYSESFRPVIGRETSRNAEDELVIGEPLQPERGRQYEIGVKADLFDERLSATLALYHLTRTNVSTTGGDAAVQEQVGEQRSQGVEFNVTGEILPGWNIIASYAYTDAVVTEDNRFQIGDRLPNVPENAASLWTTYEIQTGILQGLGFGIGLFYQDERLGDLENSFTLPSYWRTDASLFYRRDRLRVALNVRNLFDVEYYEGARNNVRVIPGAPFTLSGTVSWEF
jgi:iron complex outermembrane recepter protein